MIIVVCERLEKEVKFSRKTIAAYLFKFQQTGYDFKGLLAFSDQDLDQILGLIKSDIPQDTDPRKLTKKLEELVSPVYCFGRSISGNILWDSRFCELLKDHVKIGNAAMHFEHYPAKMLQVDFAGDQLFYVDVSTGELIGCPVFVAALPFSGYGYN